MVIPVLQPSIDEETKQELMKVLDSGWWGQGPKVIEFEKAFADKVGSKYAVATNSCTSALDICIKVYGIKDGELITPAFTFVSDAIVGFWNNMDVTFSDIEEDSLCIDPQTLPLSKNTKVIIAVDSHGRLAQIDNIRNSIKKYNEKNKANSINPLIIEDAAHAMLTTGAGKKGDIAVWSFQAVKSMPIGDGGMITTNDENIYNKLRELTWLGIRKSTYERAQGKRYSWNYDIPFIEGIKAYMTDIQAVIGLGQLKRLDDLLAKRRAVQSIYNEAFRDIPQIKIPVFSETVQYYTAQFEDRDRLSDFLADHGITTSVHFKPIHLMSAYTLYKKHPLPVTDSVWLKLLTLPCYDALTYSQQEYIIKCVKEFYE